MIKTHFPLETALFIAPKPMVIIREIETFQFFPEDIFYCAEDRSLIYLLHIIWFWYFYNIYEQDYVCSMFEKITHHVGTLKAH